LGRGLSPWRTVAASVIGSGHRARDVECQDTCAVDVVAGTLLLAVADGAGSAPRAAEGSAIAVDAAMACLRDLATTIDSCPLRVFDALVAARAALATDLAERATTLLVAAATPTVIATAQIGDGAIVVRRNDALEVPAAVGRGEYLNETCFLTSSGWLTEARTAVVRSEGVDAVAGMTDGLQLLAFDLATGAAHAPFFTPLFSFARDEGSVEELEAFLASDRVGSRTDDDVTLALAVRPTCP
jgi:hypothetical protein